jgi:outer membrane PBP1 activator LpoA protein
MIAVMATFALCAGCAGVRPLPPPTISRTPAAASIRTQPLRVVQPSRPTPLPVTAGARSIALLLPLSGRFEAPAQAIRDGFFAAHLASSYPRPDVVSYDSSESVGGLLVAFDTAMSKGPDVLVGPLLKAQVEALAQQRELTWPVLALNFLAESHVAPPGLYQFGLAPEDEAREAAASAIENGLRIAVVLAEASEWGVRTATAFRDRYAALGGRVLDTQQFAAGKDPSDAIHDLLSTSTDARSGSRDVQMVFVAAGAEQSRMIVPELRFFWHRDHTLVVYGAAASYGRSMGAPDQEGLRFCGTPVVQAAESSVIDAGAAAWGSPINRIRLQGLGYDAYRAARAIVKGDFSSGTTMEGKTGTLVMKDDRSIHRRLPCSEMTGGRLQALRPDESTQVN